jgi:hypothetical protein
MKRRVAAILFQKLKKPKRKIPKKAEYELRYKPTQFSTTGIKIKCYAEEQESDIKNLALENIRNIFPSKMPNEMDAKINQAQSTIDVEAAVFPLNDYWNRSEKVLGQMAVVEEKLSGFVELTAAPFIINVASQILLLIIGKQPKPPRSTSYFDTRLREMVNLSKLLKRNNKELCDEANMLLDKRNNLVHYQTMNQVENDLSTCKKYLRLYDEELESLIGELEKEIILKFDKIRSLVNVALNSNDFVIYIGTV